MQSFTGLKQLISEGGNAVDGVVRINQENTLATVKSILKEFLPKLKLKEKDVALLGSTGKKAPGASSGDIDMALSATEILKVNNVDTYDDMITYVCSLIKKSGYAFKDIRSLGIVSVAYPITNVDGKQEGEKVQVDLMLVQDIKYAAWAFYSPHYLESTLSGLFRNLLNFNVAKYADLNVSKIDPETLAPIEWSRYWLTNQGGLLHGSQTNLSTKTGKIVKTIRPLEKKTVSMDPDEIVKFLYGSKWVANDLLTFDKTLAAVMAPTFPFKDKRKTILNAISMNLQHEGYPIPEALAKAIG